MTAVEVLQKHFGYDNFRYGQDELINDILEGKDVLGIMPTGAGKSICFQVPTMMLNGVTIVVSPLISLMMDQVDALNQSGIPAAFINSTLSERQMEKALQNAENGAYKLIYVAPERLMSQEFLYFCRVAQIPLVAVDEAHCISQWGQDFRPAYTAIPNFVAQLQQRPVIAAFTATATPRVKDDILSKLNLKSPSVMISGFDRPNLSFDVSHPPAKGRALASFLSGKDQHASGIIYCTTRKDVERVHENILGLGYSATRYHAGLDDSERAKNQEDFLHDRKPIMVATNAFGMGIDKSNVSFVVHYNMPKDIEAYYQEAGRAGRDGGTAECLMFYADSDYATHMFFIEETRETISGEETTAKIYRLNQMRSYCHSHKCLRGHILEYFGENPDDNCGNCGNCSAEFEEVDITLDAQKIISCVARMENKRQTFGLGIIIDVLRGKDGDKIRQWRLNRLPTFGITQTTKVRLAEIASHLVLEGFLIKTTDRYPVLKLGKRAYEIKNSDFHLTMRGRKPTVTATEETVDTALLEALKALRLDLAKVNNLPAYTIFHNTTLLDMCTRKPTNIKEFLLIDGIGQVKADKYGAVFLEAIAKYSR
ncbi:MAG: DNA helicase RecQ [Defluviitaleaceae bacterium]|nr:DNA helicase RecQ [Defluviitaleaceae bacterium]